MSRSRVGSLGRRLSYWLALQSLAGLVVICAAVYAATQVGLQNRQADTLTQKRAQLQHLLVEAARDGDTAALKHKLDEFFIGHEDLACGSTGPMAPCSTAVRQRRWPAAKPAACNSSCPPRSPQPSHWS